jgi:hypothetical protein
MVTVAVEKQSAIDTYQVKYRTELKDKTLSVEDWEELRTISAFLQNFKEATLSTEGENGYIGDHLIILDGLYDIVDEELVSIPLPFIKFVIYLGTIYAWS